jgi:hypothetical protein
MAKMLRFFGAFVLCLISVGIAPNLGLAQGADCHTNFNFEPSSQEPDLLSLFRIFSKEQKTSLLVEIPYEATSMKLAPGRYSLNELTRMFVPALQCEVVKGIVHIFDERALSLPGNALNYRFAFFKTPSNVDGFRTLLKGRLTKEAFAPSKSGKNVIQELGGGTSWSANQFPLPESTYQDIQARDLIFGVATRYILSSVICFPSPQERTTDLDVWKFAADHWYWSMNQEKAAPR